MNPWPIAPLGIRDLNFQPVNYDFTTLTASDLGDTPNMLADIDQTMNEFITSIVDQSNLIASMENDLDDLGAILSEIDVDNFESIAADLAGIAGSLDTLGDLGNVPLPL